MYLNWQEWESIKNYIFN